MRVNGYTLDLPALAALHRALGDETRLRIVRLLAQHGELCVCDVEAVLDVTQSKASRHLNHLKQAGIAVDRRDRNWVHYRLAPDAPRALASAIHEALSALEGDPQVEQDRVRAARLTPAASCSPAPRPERAAPAERAVGDTR